jgi:hypothetical protein
MTDRSPARRYAAAALIGVSLVLGAWLRLTGLENRSISHPEMYVPGIRLPEGISEPVERMTFTSILSGTFSSDTHPPGYYLMMLPWTRAVGTSLRAIRLPSALFGLASIPLLFWLGSLTGWRLAGGVAAALLAVSGYHVFWSQAARMFALACFLGLSATVLLVLIARGSPYRRILTPLYIVLILAGLAAHVFFWSLFAVHMIWTLGNAWGEKTLPGFCRAQLLGLMLGSPLIAFAAYQSGNTVADLSANVFLYFAQFLTFAFALPSSNSGFFTGEVPFTGNALFWVARALLFVLAAVLLVVAVRNLWRPMKERLSLEMDGAGVWWKLGWIVAALIASSEIAGFLWMTRKLPPEFVRETIRLTKALSILPVVILASAFLLDWAWPRLPQPGGWKRFVAGIQPLLVLLGVGPLFLLGALSQVRPVLNQRGLMFATPYLLLLLSIGLVSLRARWIAMLAPVLVVMCVASAISYRNMMMDPADYGRFAGSFQQDIHPGDLIFIQKAWYTTPILYYLGPDRYRLVGRNYAAASAGNPDARVWVVMLYDLEPTKDMKAALTEYQPVRTVATAQAKAILYQRGAQSQRFEN